jgi:hypothetical protein
MAGKQQRGNRQSKRKPHKKKSKENKQQNQISKRETKKKQQQQLRARAVAKQRAIIPCEPPIEQSTLEQCNQAPVRPTTTALEIPAKKLNMQTIEKAIEMIASLTAESKLDAAKVIDSLKSKLIRLMRKSEDEKKLPAERKRRVALRGQLDTALASVNAAGMSAQAAGIARAAATKAERRAYMSTTPASSKKAVAKSKRKREDSSGVGEDKGVIHAAEENHNMPAHKRVRQKLKNDGWEKVRSKNHDIYQRLVVNEDENGKKTPSKQTLTMACTPSDWRASRNALCQMNKLDEKAGSLPGQSLFSQGAKKRPATQPMDTAFRFDSPSQRAIPQWQKKPQETFHFGSSTVAAPTAYRDGSTRSSSGSHAVAAGGTKTFLETEDGGCPSLSRESKKRKLYKQTPQKTGAALLESDPFSKSLHEDGVQLKSFALGKSPAKGNTTQRACHKQGRAAKRAAKRAANSAKAIREQEVLVRLFK